MDYIRIMITTLTLCGIFIVGYLVYNFNYNNSDKVLIGIIVMYLSLGMLITHILALYTVSHRYYKLDSVGNKTEVQKAKQMNHHWFYGQYIDNRVDEL